MPEPQTRARNLQEWLELVEKDEEPQRSRFLAKIPAEMRAEIDGASRIAWMPMAMHVKFADVLQEAYGITRAHAFYRRAATAWTNGPILGPVLKTAIGLLGLTPATVVRWAPRGWDASFRNAGLLRGVLVAPGHAQLLYQDLPAICTDSDAWVASAQGSAYGVLDVIGVEGVIRLDASGRAEGRMQLDIEWVVKSDR